MLYFGYDVPTCGSRVPFCIYCACLFTVHICDVVGYFLYGVVVGAVILISIRTIGGRDWPGVGNGVPICVCGLLHCSAPHPYTWTRWLVVRQIDGPCQFFCRN